ncbi:MAG: M1 family metallopeptidase [Deltaproteobacteria bacterium]|nr:MAG: M1 family metallopeptidase [Deltaproteobacteria bacterium]
MRHDPHSYADDLQPRTRHLELDLRPDFEKHTLRAVTTLHLSEPGQGPFDLDTRGLAIETVDVPDGAPVRFELAREDPILGARLRVHLPEGTRAIRIRSTASRDATALQWLEPAQTAGKKRPFLYSQCQPIHARSLLPLQDTPAIRITYRARLHAPEGVRPLMAAARRGPGEFEMPEPIPPYLIAFAVGDLESRELSPRSAVWAEPSVVGDAAWEFAGIEAVIAAAEGLFGDYAWERFDVLVLPPSFPYGGMENPRLAFLTPSIVAGDRSLVNVVAHELAHAWTGNLVTNLSANDFWLNEGFTVYAERRILEALEGRDRSELHAAVGRQDLSNALRRFEARPELTRLRNDLAGIDPDEAYSTVPYEKGYLLLRHLEETVGRTRWDAFLRDYLDRFRFQSLATQDFLDFLEKRLPGVVERAGVLRYVDSPGIPHDAPVARAERLDRLLARAAKNEVPERADPTELLLYLNALRTPLRETCEEVEARYRIRARRSLELRTAFAVAQLRAGMPEGAEEARKIALGIGRMKFLRALYTELQARPATREKARKIFEEARGTYHPIAAQVIESILRG